MKVSRRGFIAGLFATLVGGVACNRFTPTVIPTATPTPENLIRPEKYCTELVENFGNVTIEGAETGVKPGDKPLVYYYKLVTKNEKPEEAVVRGLTTSVLRFYTPYFRDNAGLPIERLPPGMVVFPHAYIDKENGRLVFDVPVGREFAPNIVLSSLKRSKVGLETTVPIEPDVVGISYKIRGGGHPVVANVYVNGELVNSTVLSSGFLQYTEQAELGYVPVIFNLLNETPIRREAKAELRIETLTNNSLHILYQSELEKAQKKGGGVSLFALGDIGTTAEVEGLYKIRLCQ